MSAEQDREKRINQRAREIRYGDGCSAEEALRRATEEASEWDRVKPSRRP